MIYSKLEEKKFVLKFKTKYLMLMKNILTKYKIINLKIKQNINVYEKWCMILWHDTEKE